MTELQDGSAQQVTVAAAGGAWRRRSRITDFLSSDVYMTGRGDLAVLRVATRWPA